MRLKIDPVSTRRGGFYLGSQKLSKSKMKIMIFAWVFTAVLCFSISGMADDFADKAKKPVQEAIDIRQQTQKSEDRWVAEKEKLTAQYEALEAQIKEQTQLNQGLKKDVSQHTQTTAALKQKIEDMEKISQEIEPYILQTFERIKTHMYEGPPFLKEEREKRILKLEGIVQDSQVKISEKFRRLAETLMIEAEYGSTIEVYPESITFEGKDVQMRIFRLGRLSLFCQSLDKKRTGYYDVADGKWEKLPETYNSDVDTAMEIGAKRRPVDLVNLPLGRMAVQ